MAGEEFKVKREASGAQGRVAEEIVSPSLAPEKQAGSFI
jgi:hypothetical protein